MSAPREVIFSQSIEIKSLTEQLMNSSNLMSRWNFQKWTEIIFDISHFGGASWNISTMFTFSFNSNFILCRYFIFSFFSLLTWTSRMNESYKSKILSESERTYQNNIERMRRLRLYLWPQTIKETIILDLLPARFVDGRKERQKNDEMRKKRHRDMQLKTHNHQMRSI